MAKEDTRRYSPESLRAQRDRGKTETRADIPAHAIDAEFWNDAHVVMPSSGKTSVHLRLDTEVLEWFKSSERGHLTRLNAVLKSYVDAQKQQGR
ncbi:BrnA antitoxin family protein [Rhodopila sp.]|uniref:BrnA antitoxin family protein n=1 Tax=Rhodopila sp. TaxID=2480087 RepID=UPI003D1473CA